MRRLLVGLLAALATGCAPDCRTGTQRRNVVLVTVDTLRADHLGCYGSRTVRTPALDRLAREGVLFERCYATAPITVPSHASLLTSLPPGEHGALDNAAVVAPRAAALPAVLRRAGYRTAAFVGAKFLGSHGRFGRGFPDFEVYDAPPRASQPRRAADTTAEVTRWMRGVCREPFFAWVHYWDPHMPYEPPAPFDAMYYQGDPRAPAADGMAEVQLGWFFHETRGLRRALERHAREVRALKRDLGRASSRSVRRLVLDPAALEPRDGDGAAIRARLAALGSRIRPTLPLRAGLADWLTGIRDVRFPRARYAGEVSYVDAAVGDLRAGLERLGIAERTALVVVADHGEALGEHGVWFDHVALHEPVLHVPLLVWAPGAAAPARRAEVVSGLDVAPTVLGLAGVAVPAAMRGRDLLAPGYRPRTAVAEGPRRRQVAIVDGRWKLVRTLERFFYTERFARDAGAAELFDVEADRAEERDRAAHEPAVTSRLAGALDAWLAHHGAAPVPDAPAPAPALERQLRALGYVE